ncbi:hypothetical protein F4692_002394 [Nocardioides cavernae]|uniref:Uncharacterized protein n=1 Tax=Nocardioides cavernae TaxID=1921566 RepID=A0A7Y9H436_9ACTN|nr:hypothetical protein [Nocardioides cavernae]NYE37261.1 hypothetical protein [Nocardioides cavernae]
MSGILDQVEPLFEEIADLIGQLAGNEAALRFQNAEWDREPPEGYTREQVALTYPGDHGFERVSGIVMMSTTHPDFMSGSTTNADIMRAMQDGINEVWEREHSVYKNGATSTLFRIYSKNIWEPDAEVIESSANRLADLSRFLDSQLTASAGWVPVDDTENAPDWLPRLKADWPATSQSSGSFYEFWNDVNDKCALYRNATARLGAATAAVCSTVSDYQKNLVKAAQQTRDQARLALQQWQEWKEPSGAWPTGELQDNSLLDGILGGVSYGTGVVALIPPASLIAGTISVITGGLAYAVPSETRVMEATQALTAKALFDGFTADLQQMSEEMGKALDAIRSEPVADVESAANSELGLTAYVHEVEGSQRDWSPPEVNL